MSLAVFLLRCGCDLKSPSSDENVEPAASTCSLKDVLFDLLSAFLVQECVRGELISMSG